jgi:hypothetical protein
MTAALHTITRGLKRYWLTLAFIGGFVTDLILLNRVDDLFDNLILLFYVVLASISLLLFYAGVAGRLGERLSPWFRNYAPLAIQYASGGLLSGMLIFYGRSGDLVASWPFLVIIIAAIYGNEVITNREQRLVFNLAFLFIGLLPYVVLVTSVFTGMMGPFVFVGAGLIALGLMYFFVQLLYAIIPRYMEMQTRALVLTLGAIYIGFNGLYFTNIIPPIPLSLKSMGMYHSVVKFENNTYQLKWFDGPWWNPLQQSDAVFYPSAASSVYCFTSVFAPTTISTRVFHRWEYQNEAGEWVEHARIDYPIVGGSDQGYRGYTQVSSYRAGTWRCSIETERGQVLGRAVFSIAAQGIPSPGELKTRIE